MDIDRERLSYRTLGSKLAAYCQPNGFTAASRYALPPRNSHLNNLFNKQRGFLPRFYGNECRFTKNIHSPVVVLMRTDSPMPLHAEIKTNTTEFVRKSYFSLRSSGLYKVFYTHTTYCILNTSACLIAGNVSYAK